MLLGDRIGAHFDKICHNGHFFKDLFGKSILNANSKQYRNVDTRTFICKQCNYTTPSRKSWWSHKWTKKHKKMFNIK